MKAPRSPRSVSADPTSSREVGGPPGRDRAATVTWAKMDRPMFGCYYGGDDGLMAGFVRYFNSAPIDQDTFIKLELSPKLLPFGV